MLEPISHPDHLPAQVLDDCIEAYEQAWSDVSAESLTVTGDGAPEVGRFFPPTAEPAYAATVLELLRVDLEYRWRWRCPVSLVDYIARHPEVLHDRRARSELAYEEYRLRHAAGERVTPAEYARQYSVEVSDWHVEERRELESNQPAEHDTAVPTGSRTAGRAHPRGVTVSGWEPQIGQRVLDFELLEQLGVGRFGRVFLARQTDLADRKVVIKFSREQWRESDLLAQLQHPHIVPVYSVHYFEEWQLVCMPFCGRLTLAGLIAKLGGGLAITTSQDVAAHWGAEVPADRPSTGRPELLSHEAWCLQLIQQLARGLGHAHDKGIVHRDLKPANVLITTAGAPMLLDFNLSSQVLVGGARDTTVGGTLPYLAPEHLTAILTGGPVTASADVYSLGVMLYELLLGQLPFVTRREKDLATLISQLSDDRREVTSAFARLRPRVSAGTWAIMERCLAPEPTQRYQHAAELAFDLACQSADLPLRYARNSSWSERIQKWRRRHRRLVAGLSVAVAGSALVATAAGTIYYQDQLHAGRAAQAKYEEWSDALRAAGIALTLPVSDREQVERTLAHAATLYSDYQAGTPLGWWRNPAANWWAPSQRAAMEHDIGQLCYLLAANHHRLASMAGAESAEVAAHQRQAERWNRAAEQHFAEAPDRFAADEQRQAWAFDAASSSAASSSAVNSSAVSSSVPANTHRPQVSDQWSPGQLPTDVSAAEASRWAPHQRLAASVQLMALRDYLSARRRLTELSSELPQDFSVWFLLGHCHFVLGDLDAAHEAYSICIALQPESPLGYYQRALCRLEQERPLPAVADLDVALQLDPQSGASLVNRALAKKNSGDLAGALQDLNRALTVGRTDARTYLLRARVQRELGNLAAAAADQELGLRAEPVDEAGWIARGLVRLKSNPELARRDFAAAVSWNPRSRLARKYLVLVLAEYLHDVPAAIQVLNEMIHDDAANEEAWMSRAVLQARAGTHDAARHDAVTALQLKPTPLLLYQAACVWSLSSAGDTQRLELALQFWQHAARQDERWRTSAADDPDLEELRKLPQFAAELQRLTAEGTEPNERLTELLQQAAGEGSSAHRAARQAKHETERESE